MLIPFATASDQWPRTLHGFDVIHAEPCAHCLTVLIERDEDYVVATWTPLCGDHWTNPNFFWDFAAATAAFDRIAKARS